MKNEQFKTITVGELRRLLEGEDDDVRIIFTADYGDYHHTPQALAIRGELTEATIAESGYSNSGFALADEEGVDYDEDELFLVIR